MQVRLHFLSNGCNTQFHRRTVELAQSEKRTSTIKDVQEVFRSMQHNPITAYLQDCSFHERLMLASLVKCMKREGVEEIKWGEVSFHETSMEVCFNEVTFPFAARFVTSILFT